MRISDQDYNQLLVLRTIRRLEPIARTALARETGLAGGTITKLIGNLVARNMVIEERVRRKAKGRPQIHLRINPAAGAVVGAWIAVDGHLAVEVVDFQGGRLYSATLQMRRTTTLRELAGEIAGLLNTVMASSELQALGISRVGITLPGMLDHERGLVRWIATYPRESIAFAEVIAHIVGLPVVIDSSTNVMARAEHWFGSGDKLDDFLLINLDVGMGAAYYREGTLCSGANGVNSELAHVKVAPDDEWICYCGARGCLANYVSLGGMHQQLPGADVALRTASLDLDSIRADFARCAQAALAGDPRSLGFFHRAGRLLGLAVANEINTRDPGRVILSAFESSLLQLLEPAFHQALKEFTLPVLLEMTTIELMPINDEMLWRGAAALGLEKAYIA